MARLIKGENDFASLFPGLLEEWDYSRNTISPSEVTAGSNRKVWWICNKCGNLWQASIGSRARGHGCPVCSRREAIVRKADSFEMY